ncbi:hypothetical protein ACWEKJ_03190 [Amycolatopsis thermoflava]|uniref:hypothetical protein n=1 Tax=Amycolatopsis thermoflava TaxID=84480 RepID=UPI003F4A23ED
MYRLPFARGSTVSVPVVAVAAVPILAEPDKVITANATASPPPVLCSVWENEVAPTDLTSTVPHEPLVLLAPAQLTVVVPRPVTLL